MQEVMTANGGERKSNPYVYQEAQKICHFRAILLEALLM
jgi:hypothetical protein